MSVFKLVSYPPDRLNAPAVRPQMLPQRFDVGVHRAGVSKVVEAPDLVQQLFPGEDDPLVFRQLHRQVEFLGGQADGLPVHLEEDGAEAVAAYADLVTVTFALEEAEAEQSPSAAS